MPGLDAVSFLSSAGIANVVELTVASLVSPTELNSVGLAVPDWRLCRPVSAGTDDATLYRLDASTDAVSAPYIMASATVGLRWVAIAGRYVNSAITSAGAVTGTNISGTNTGDVTLAAIGAVPNANAASLSGQVLTIQPASASFGGLITTGPQTIAGAKTFLSLIVSKPAGSAGIAIDPNAATGDFTLSLSPANLTAARRWSYPDRSDTVAGLGAQTFAGAQTIAALTLITDTTDATSLTAAAHVVNGGAAVAKILRVGLGIILGTDPGGADILRVGGAIRASGNLSSGGGFLISGTGASVAIGVTIIDRTDTTNSRLIFCGPDAANGGAVSFVSSSSTAGVFTTVLKLLPSAVIFGTDPGGSEFLRLGGSLRISSATMIATSTSFTNGAAAAAGTLANAPVAGNPTKWIPINDNGTTRYIPAW